MQMHAGLWINGVLILRLFFFPVWKKGTYPEQINLTLQARYLDLE